MLKFLLFILIVCLSPIMTVHAGSSASAQCLARIKQEREQEYKRAYNTAYALGIAAIKHADPSRRAQAIRELVEQKREEWFMQNQLEASMAAVMDILNERPNKFA